MKTLFAGKLLTDMLGPSLSSVVMKYVSNTNRAYALENRLFLSEKFALSEFLKLHEYFQVLDFVRKNSQECSKIEEAILPIKKESKRVALS